MEKTLPVTKAERKDATAITQLINDAYRGDPGSPAWTSEGQYMDGERTAVDDITRLLEQPDTDNFKYCAANGDIVGFVSLQKQEQAVYLGLLTVNPQMQAGGIGRHLLEYSEDYTRSNGKAAIVITVINVRQELIAWYVRRGYVPTGKVKHFPKGHNSPKVPLHLIEMQKAITAF
jgi:predicted N-acetyltransferase YhbS